MTYQVCYFGLLAERRGLREESITSAAATPAELYAELDAGHQLGLQVEHFRAAVNDEFAAWDRPLHENDRVGFLPPMSGG